MRPRVLERCAIAWLDLSESVDQVRRREQKTLKASGGDLLAGTRCD
jgi:hypothetical protein